MVGALRKKADARKPLSFSTRFALPNDAHDPRLLRFGKQHVLEARAPTAVLSCQRARAQACQVNTDKAKQAAQLSPAGPAERSQAGLIVPEQR
jgi:hypothetical protein